MIKKLQRDLNYQAGAQTTETETVGTVAADDSCPSAHYGWCRSRSGAFPLASKWREALRALADAGTGCFMLQHAAQALCLRQVRVTRVSGQQVVAVICGHNLKGLGDLSSRMLGLAGMREVPSGHAVLLREGDGGSAGSSTAATTTGCMAIRTHGQLAMLLAQWAAADEPQPGPEPTREWELVALQTSCVSLDELVIHDSEKLPWRRQRGRAARAAMDSGSEDLMMEQAWGALSGSREGAGRGRAGGKRGGRGDPATARARAARQASDSDLDWKTSGASVAAPCSCSSAAFSKSSESEPELEQRQQRQDVGASTKKSVADMEAPTEDQHVQHAEAAAKDQHEQRAEAAAEDQHVQRADRCPTTTPRLSGGLGSSRMPLTPFALVQETLGGRPLPAHCHIYAGAGCRSFVAKRSGFTVPGSSAPVARHGSQQAAILHAYDMLLRHVRANPQWPPRQL